MISAVISAYAADPVAYYPFDSDLRDYSGNGNHGTMVDGDEGPLLTVLHNSGITTNSGEFQVGGGALNMSADRDSVQIPVGLLASDTNGWAIVLWSRDADAIPNSGGMVIGNTGNTANHIQIDSQAKFRVRSSGANAIFEITTEDTLWHHYAIIAEDHDTDGSFDDVTLYKDGVYVNTVSNAAGSGFSATHIGSGYTDQFDYDFHGQIDEVYIYDAAITSNKVQELYGSAPDTTAPIVVEILDDRIGGPVEPGSLVTYTVTFSEDLDESTVNPSDFGVSGTAGGSIGTVTEIAPRFFEAQVTPATAGTLQLQINQTATLLDPAGNALDTGTAILDDTVITVETDNTNPTLLPADIQDDQAGGPVDQGSTVTYTLTFSEEIDHTTLDASDFGNQGTASFTIGSINEILPNVFRIGITPDSTGTLQLEVLDTAQIADAAGNLLDVTGGIAADTTITVESGPNGVTHLRVFLLGGQSNALGSNQTQASNLPTSPENLQLPREDIPFYFGGNNVLDSPNPYERLIGLQPITNGRFGPEITMGRSLTDSLADGTNTLVAIIKYARGATDLANQWKGGGDNTLTGDGNVYEFFQISLTEGLAALAAAYTNATIDIEGMLWVQGEWDAIDPAKATAYETNLTNFIADIRATYGADLPFVICRLSSGQTYIDPTGLATVQAAQDAVAAADPLADVFNTDSFDLFGDDLHFSELGLQQIGEAASSQLLNYFSVPSPPQISTLTPAHLSSGSFPNADLSITFDEDVAFGSGNITLRQTGGSLVESFSVNPVSASLSLSGDTVTINPSSNLSDLTTYYVEIATNAIEDLDGFSFAGISGDGTWQFTTGELDLAEPQIQTRSPGNGASDVAVSSSLTITFTEDVVFGSGTISLRQSGGTLIESFDVANPPVGLSLSGASLTIDPSTNLTPSTTYYVEMDATAIDDLAGNSFAGFTGSSTWSFTTAQSLDASPIAGVDFEDGSGGFSSVPDDLAPDDGLSVSDWTIGTGGNPLGFANDTGANGDQAYEGNFVARFQSDTDPSFFEITIPDNLILNLASVTFAARSGSSTSSGRTVSFRTSLDGDFIYTTPGLPSRNDTPDWAGAHEAVIDLTAATYQNLNDTTIGFYFGTSNGIDIDAIVVSGIVDVKRSGTVLLLR